MDDTLLAQAIELSKESIKYGGYPVGALIVLDAVVIGKGVSNGKQEKDATSHAEIAAIRDASNTIGKRNLTGATLYTSMEPCLMCFSACYWAYIEKVVFALPKEKLHPMHSEGLHSNKEINSKNNRKIDIVHIPELESEAANIVASWEHNQKIHL